MLHLTGNVMNAMKQCQIVYECVAGCKTQHTRFKHPCTVCFVTHTLSGNATSVKQLNTSNYLIYFKCHSFVMASSLIIIIYMDLNKRINRRCRVRSGNQFQNYLFSIFHMNCRFDCNSCHRLFVSLSADGRFFSLKCF